jgi:hypothetical protein
MLSSANSDAAKLQHSFRSLGGSVFGIPEIILKARLSVPVERSQTAPQFTGLSGGC